MAFKNNAPLIIYISKINNTLIDNAEDWDIVMPMHNLIQYSKIIQKQGSLWSFYRVEPNSVVGGESNINYSIKDWKSFDYKQKLQGVEKATI